MKFALRRFIASLFVLWGVVTITFFLLHLTPGDPVQIMMHDYGTGPEADAVRHQLGLDMPLTKQYAMFFGKLLHGDLGISYFSKKPVLKEIAEHLPSTFLLAATSMMFAILVGIPLGVLAAMTRSKTVETFTSVFSLIGLSIPSFWLAPMLIVAFAIKLDWFPVDEQEGLGSLILPTVSLGLGLSAVVLRMTRAAMLEVMSEEYIRVARAKGLNEAAVLFKHALKNALTPILTIVSLQFGAVLTGVVITETIFDWPGLGILLYQGLTSRNYPLVQGCILCMAFLYVLVNLLTDFAYVVVNPRLRVFTEAGS